MNVRPLHDRIIVQRIEEGEQKVGGIIIPDTAKENPNRARSSPPETADEGRWQAPSARCQSRRSHPVRQVFGAGDQARRGGIPDHARTKSGRDRQRAEAKSADAGAKKSEIAIQLSALRLSAFSESQH